MTRQRVLTAAVLAPLAIAAVLFLPTPLLAALAAAALLGGLWEWSRLAGLESTLRRVAYLTVNAALMAALAWSARPGLFPFQLMVVIGALWWVLACVWLSRFELLSRPGTAACSLKLAAGTLAVIPAWAALVLLHAENELGPRWALFALALVWAADTGAYFVGVRFGRRKLAPRISPGKSWEGLWGGLAACALLALFAWPLLGLNTGGIPALIALALAAGAFSVVGDLLESLLKRHSGHKDSGHLIPGHGGILDRVDSVLAALPIFVLGKLWLGI